MHELAIMQSVVSLCEREAAEKGFSRVRSIALAVGAVSGFEPGCMFEFFPAAALGSVAEGARLETRVIPAAIECPDCGYTGKAHGAECPRCGGWGFRLTQGREFYIDSIEVE